MFSATAVKSASPFRMSTGFTSCNSLSRTYCPITLETLRKTPKLFFTYTRVCVYNIHIRLRCLLHSLHLSRWHTSFIYRKWNLTSQVGNYFISEFSCPGAKALSETFTRRDLVQFQEHYPKQFVCESSPAGTTGGTRAYGDRK